MKANLFSSSNLTRVNPSHYLQLIALKVNIPELHPLSITIWCTIYLPSSHNTNFNHIDPLFNTLPSPDVICGDFNTRRPIWRVFSNNPFHTNSQENIIDQALPSTPTFIFLHARYLNWPKLYFRLFLHDGPYILLAPLGPSLICTIHLDSVELNAIFSSLSQFPSSAPQDPTVDWFPVVYPGYAWLSYNQSNCSAHSHSSPHPTQSTQSPYPGSNSTSISRNMTRWTLSLNNPSSSVQFLTL